MSEDNKPDLSEGKPRVRRVWRWAALMTGLLICSALIYVPGSPLVQNAYDSRGTSEPIHGQAALWLRIGFWGVVLLSGALLFRMDQKDKPPHD